MNNRKQGFISTLLLIIVGLAALKYFFDWSIFDAAASEQGRGTVAYIRDVLSTTWTYIGAPVMFVWNEIVRPIFEFAFTALKQMIGEGRTNLGQ